MDSDLLKAAQAKGTDADYRAFIQRQPSALSGTFSEWLEDGTGRNPACHVRRANSSGTGFKGSFCCIPLTQAEHLRAHQKGDSAIGSKGWWDEKRLEYLRRWVES